MSGRTFASIVTHDCGGAGTTGGKSSGARPTSRYVAPPHRSRTITLSVTLSSTAAAGSSFTISASFLADTVMDPFEPTFAGTVTRAPTSRSVAVIRTPSPSASSMTLARIGSVLLGYQLYTTI